MHFCCGGGAPACGAVCAADDAGRVGRDGASQFQLHEHIDGAMLQRLERPDRPSELRAGLDIVDGSAMQRRHRADRFGAKGDVAEIERSIEYG